ncbi:helix-turn-helix domain-containing protein [Bradyrhizobium sp. B120]|uniref:helix-turn-helix domain-containing protein n=1 Tax=Bradyrhizobium sp. B120 TaxID=3410088 RepID=UPI003B9877A8
MKLSRRGAQWPQWQIRCIESVVSANGAMRQCSADVELRDLGWAVIAYSFRRAAPVLNIAQSNLSPRLRFIEQQLGAELFLRTNGDRIRDNTFIEAFNGRFRAELVGAEAAQSNGVTHSRQSLVTANSP